MVEVLFVITVFFKTKWSCKIHNKKKAAEDKNTGQQKLTDVPLAWLQARQSFTFSRLHKDFRNEDNDMLHYDKEEESSLIIRYCRDQEKGEKKKWCV